MTAKDRLLFFLISLINALLCGKALLRGAIPYRESIERGYAYFGKLFAANPDYLSWNTLQYCGIPMHYVYLPLLPYTDALLLRLIPGADATHVHRVVCGIALLLGPAAVFLLVLEFAGRRRPAFWSAMTVTFLSPLYVLLAGIQDDRGFMDVPWRVQTLIKYGEGPHTVGLLLLLLSLVAVHRAARRPGAAPLVLAAASLAAVVLTNWVAGLALAFCVLMLLLVHFRDDSFSVRRVLLAGLIGYGLAAFWLTPSFVFQMFFNWPKDAFGYQLAQKERLALGAWVAALLLLRIGFGRWSANRYLCWITLCATLFGIPVTLFYAYGLNVFPESRRYALEYELFLLLLWIEIGRILLANSRRKWRWTGVLILYCGLLAVTPRTVGFLANRFDKWNPVPATETSEFRVASALNGLHPTGRVHLSGGTRFRINAWYPLEQTGGVFETGLRTRLTQDIAYQIRTDLSFRPGDEAAESIVLLRALGVEYVVVHGKDSKEFYRDYKNPEKFDGHLQRVWSEDGDTIYRMPSFRMAHVVNAGELPTHTVTLNDFRPWAKYISAQTDPQRPSLRFEWIDARRARVTGSLPAGVHVAFAIPWDPNWRAYQANAAIPVQASPVGLMVVGPVVAGEQIDLVFTPSLEERTAAGISLLTLAGCIVWLWRSRR